MKKMMKVGVFAAALAVFVPAFAQDAVEEEVAEQPAVEEEVAEENDGVYGWTPIAFGLATPVQLPWGLNMWDVFGFDFNFFYADAPLMYGFELSGGVCRTREEMIGAMVSGLCNWSTKDVYGMRATIGGNFCNGTLYGADLGMFGVHRTIYGADIEFLAGVQEEIWGGQLSLIGNVTKRESHGATISGGFNFAETAYGCQFALVYNQTEELHGCQIGLVNYARECDWGFQVGLVNIIMDNKVKVLPIVNGFFGEKNK